MTTVELVAELPTQSEWNRLNRFLREKLVLSLRDQIINKIGEGPYPKFHLENRQLAPEVIKTVAARTKAMWLAQTPALVEMIVRYPEADSLNVCDAPCQQPIKEALSWAGWCVAASDLWLFIKIKGTVVGDDKLVMDIKYVR